MNISKLRNKGKKLKLTTLGFTLIELLAVIVILAVIALIAIPVIMNIISKANKSAFKDSAYGIVKAGELYYSEKLLNVDGMKEDISFTFPEATGLDLKGSRPTSGNMKVSKEGKVALAISNGKYCIRKGYNDIDVTIDKNIEDCEIIKIVTSNDSCVDDGICSNGTKVNVKVNNKESYDFYVIKDDGINLTLIMDRNLGGKVAWYHSQDNTNGPLTALKELKTRTSNWTNIESYSYELVDDKPDAWGNTVRYEPISGIDEITDVRARMLTYTEASRLGCVNTTINSCPTYLYENLSSENTEDAPYGYWLSTTYSSDSLSGSCISGYGKAGSVSTHSTIHNGLRPVIEVSKTL